MSPLFPKLREGIAFVPCPDGFVAEGGASRKLFLGRVPAHVFGPLLPFLDGKLSLGEIAARLEVSPQFLSAVLGNLQRHQVLDMRTSPAAEHADPMRVFLRRTMTADRADAVQRRLLAATVTISGDDGAALLAGLLVESGVGRVLRRPPVPGIGGWQVMLASAVGTGGGRGAPVSLPVHVHRLGVSIGPLVGVEGALCPRCLAAHSAARDADDATASAAGGGARGPGSAVLGTAAGLAAGMIVRLLGEYGAGDTVDQAVEVPADGTAPVIRPVTPRPHCRACAGRVTSRLVGDPLPDPPPHRHPWSADPNPLAERPDISARKDYLTEPRRAAWLVGDQQRGLAWILRRTMGTTHPGGTGPGARSWSPWGGCPGSLRAYVRLPDQSVHYFDGQTCDLVQLAGPGPSGDRTGAIAACITGDLAATAAAVGESAAPVVLYQDAGIAAGQLLRCAQAAGWELRARREADERLASVLDEDECPELVTVSVDLVPSAGRLPRTGATRRLPWMAVQDYCFTSESVAGTDILRIAAAALAGSDEIWPSGTWPRLDVECLVYSARVAGLPDGVYRYRVSGDLAAATSMAPPDPAGYLRDRGIAPAAMLLFGCGTPGGGPAGHQAATVKTAAAARLAQLAAASSGLASGLLARVTPAARPSAPRSSGRAGRAWYGCVVGHAVTPPNGTEIVMW